MKYILIFRTTLAGSLTERPAPPPPPCDGNIPENNQTTRNNRRRRCKIVAAFCITFWLIAVAIATVVAFLVQDAVGSKMGDDVTLSPTNETHANSTVTSVIS